MKQEKKNLLSKAFLIATAMMNDDDYAVWFCDNNNYNGLFSYLCVRVILSSILWIRASWKVTPESEIRFIDFGYGLFVCFVFSVYPSLIGKI